MADLAIGLSKKVVDGLVKKVEGAIKEEQELWQIVERDSVFIRDEFEMMKSFLKTADRDRVRNNVVRTWVRQVRDLSYNAEDCMDDVLELKPKRPWWALPFWPRMLPTSCRPRVGKALDEAVDKIKLIKARVEEVSHRNLRYNLINTTGSQQMQQATTAMDMDLDLAKVQEGSGRMRLLLDYEACHDGLNVITVWGTGGTLGTISIIRNAFDNPNVCRVHKCRAWVKLMHPFSPQKFLGDLVAQLLTNSGGSCGADVWSKMEASSVDLAKEVEQLLKGRSYLIVLEDLSNMVEWYTIRTYLPHDEIGSRVIVSTQHQEIARLCIGQPQYVHELSQLSADHYVYAFFKEIYMPSQQNQGTTDVASLSAAANYWYYPYGGNTEYAHVRELYDLMSSSERRPPNETHVVTVFGPPDVGKDAVVDIVSKVCSQFVLSTSNNWLTPSFELYGWINVSNHPLDVRGFALSLLSALRPNNSPSHSTDDDPVHECSRLLSERRCLVVINGLRCTHDCRELAWAGLIYRHPNSCIVVVTTDERVSTYWTAATTPAAVYNIEPFESSEQRDGLLYTAGSSIHGWRLSSYKFKNYTKYWYHYCLTGRDEELWQLDEMISSSRGQKNNGARVVTVWGLPGHETYDVVAKVYSHYALSTEDPSPFQLYGWVDVSSNFNPEISLEDFLSQSLLSYMGSQLIYLPTDDETDRRNVLTKYRCLVVIEGLQSREDCQKLIDARLINGCIIVITAEESVAKFWEGTTPDAVCNIKPLNVQQQGQLPIPPSMLDDITRLFSMANSCFQKYSLLIERDDEVDRLSRMIRSPKCKQGSYTRVVIICGPPGVGKTALVEKVYHRFVHNRYARRAFDLCGWVQVSNPFNLMDFCRRLLSVLRPHSPQSPNPIRDCLNLVREHSCLIVIDGLQCKENFLELANAGFMHATPHSCIVLVTTEKSVTRCMASSLVPSGVRLKAKIHFLFQVKPLDRDSASRLFCQVSEQGGARFRYNDMYSSLVEDKCYGFPIVILAVAKYLSRVSADAVTQFTAAVKEGKFIHELATNPQPEFVGLKGLLAWVDSELKACPQSLMLLMLYMLNFSQNTVVRRKRLVWRWITEGYIKNTGICDMVTEAEERVRELEDLTMMMMQVPPGGRYTWKRGCQLSGFCSEVLMSRAAEDPLFLPLEVSALTQGKQRSLTSRGCAGRHLRIDDQRQWERSEFVFRSLDLSRLRSLTVSGRFEAFFINGRMRVLRVLDLEDATDVQYSHLEEISKLLRRLRFLSLRGCREIDRLPNSIGDLRLLQTLDIRRTNITKLPDSIFNLKNLQCLRAGHTMKAQVVGDPYIPAWWRMSSRLRGLASCSWRTLSYASRGVTMPRRMSSQLTALHTLGIVNVNTAGGEAILEELQHLKQLRNLELYGVNSYNVRGLKHLPSNLDSLSLGFTKDRDETSSSFKDGLSGLLSRRGFRFKLHGHVGIVEVLPDGLKVTDLTLDIDTQLTGDPMERIGKLPVVRTLRLHFHTGGELKFDANHLPYLEVLEIVSFGMPLHVEFGPEKVRTLKVLKLVGSLKIPTGGLHQLRFLNEVWVVEGRSLNQATMGEVLEGHKNNPVVIVFWSDLENMDPPRN